MDEVRPGNFVFYDLQQLALGACEATDLALAVACPVVGVYPARGEFVVHGGSVHLSRDAAPGPGRAPAYGRLAVVARTAGTSSPPRTASCARSPRSTASSAARPMCCGSVRVGDLAFVVPAHACMPANLIRDWVFI